jgi:hypothetical protein
MAGAVKIHLLSNMQLSTFALSRRCSYQTGQDIRYPQESRLPVCGNVSRRITDGLKTLGLQPFVAPHPVVPL